MKQRTTMSYDEVGVFLLYIQSLIVFIRFTKQEICIILSFLNLEFVQWQTWYTLFSELAFSLILVCLLFSQWLFKLTLFFEQSVAYLFTVYTDTIEYLCQWYSKMLCWHSILQYWCLWQYSQAIKRANEWREQETIWGFVNKMFQGTCRSQKEQWMMYSGYKRHHGFKYQAVICSDNLIESIAGPYEEKINDHIIVQDFGLKQNLQQVCNGQRQLFLFEDQAYKHLDEIFEPYWEERTLTDDKAAFNHCLSSIWIAVEQTFE